MAGCCQCCCADYGPPYPPGTFRVEYPYYPVPAAAPRGVAVPDAAADATPEQTIGTLNALIASLRGAGVIAE